MVVKANIGDIAIVRGKKMARKVGYWRAGFWWDKYLLRIDGFSLYSAKNTLMKTLFLAIILTALFTACFAQNKSQSATESRPPTVKELESVSLDARVDGLGNRSELIKHLCDLDSDFVFKQIKDINGQPDFYASDRYKTSVEIVGQENGLVMVQWTFRMIFYNGAATRMEINRMGVFAGGMGGKNGYEWFSNVYQNFKDKPLSEYGETKELFLNRVAEFKYSPQLKQMTLTITLKKDK